MLPSARYNRSVAEQKDEMVTIPRGQLEELCEELGRCVDSIDELSRQRAPLSMLKLRVEQMLRAAERRANPSSRSTATFQAVKDPRREPEE